MKLVEAVPSELETTTETCTASPGFVNACSGGVIVIFLTSPAPLSQRAPSSIQCLKMRYCHESLLKRTPPACSTWPLALSKSRLLSGSETLMRRPSPSRVTLK